MSPELQREAIYMFIRPETDRIQKIGNMWYGLEKENGWHSVPDYPNDLNAIRKVEEGLGHSDKREYASRLRAVSLKALRIAGDALADDFDFCHASATDRLKALVQTFGLWEDSK